MINVGKMVEYGYFMVPTAHVPFYTDLYKLPDQFDFAGLRAMTEADIDQVRDLINGFMFLNAKVH
jgi:hypothetical protein